MFLGGCCFFQLPYALGPIGPERLRQDYPEFRQVWLKTPAATPLDAPADTRVLVFFGSWCRDSLREVPRYMRLAEASGLASTYIGLDRQKSDPAGQARRWQISRTPTFVVLRGEREIGRIVERPRTDLRGDLAELLAAARLASPTASTDNSRPPGTQAIP